MQMRTSHSQRLRLRFATAAIVVIVLLFLSLAAVEQAAASDADDLRRALTKSREEQALQLERDIYELRRGELNRKLQKLMHAQANLAQAKRQEGFFYTAPKDKATIKLLDEEYQKALIEVEAVKKVENMMVAKLKPLYGPLSTHFVAEQRKTISSALTFIKDTAYDNAWYDSLFSMWDGSNEDSGFAEIILGFFIKWLMNYIVLYPFAFIYYALWAAPWSVWSYSSGLSSIVPSLTAYVLAVATMALPMVVLASGAFYLNRAYPNWQETLRRRAGRRRGQNRRHYD